MQTPNLYRLKWNSNFEIGHGWIHCRATAEGALSVTFLTEGKLLSNFGPETRSWAFNQCHQVRTHTRRQVVKHFKDIKKCIICIPRRYADSHYNGVFVVKIESKWIHLCWRGTCLDQDLRGQPHDEAAKYRQRCKFNGDSRLCGSANHKNRVR